MDDIHTEFSEQEKAILAEITGDKPGDAQPAGSAPDATASPAPAEPTKPADAAPTTQAAPQPEAPASAPAEPQHQQGGDLRAALRASRRAEQRAREEAARLRAEAEELRKRAPADPNVVTDEELRRLSDDFPQDEFPQIARLVNENRALRQVAAQATRAAPAQSQPEFVPIPQKPEVQDAIDGVPELLAWQSDPAGQDKFAAAIRMDAFVRELPAWKDKPLTERLAEVTRRVQMEIGGTPAPAAPALDPQKVIANAPMATPQRIADLSGGAIPNRNTPDYDKMTDEQIMASLPVI